MIGQRSLLIWYNDDNPVQPPTKFMHFPGNGSCGSALSAAWFLSHKSDSAETVRDGNRPVWLMHFCKFARFGSGEEGAGLEFGETCLN